jgi:hypothetical protein
MIFFLSAQLFLPSPVQLLVVVNVLLISDQLFLPSPMQLVVVVNVLLPH